MLNKSSSMCNGPFQSFLMTWLEWPFSVRSVLQKPSEDNIFSHGDVFCPMCINQLNTGVYICMCGWIWNFRFFECGAKTCPTLFKRGRLGPNRVGL